jgi:Type ISP C-terminal specificity domain
MLKKEEFISFILEGPKSFQEKEIQQGTSALPEGFEDFGFDTETVKDSPADTRATFTQRLLVASDFGLPEFVQTKNLIRSSDAVAGYLPDRASYWPKISSRPYQTLLFEADITHKDILGIPAFKSHKTSHLNIVEDALARMVSEALEGFKKGGDAVTSDVRKGRKDETLCIISIVDERDQDPVRLVCFGTYNANTGGLETFHITEHARYWDQPSARDHLGQLYERQFKKLAGIAWQEAFTTTEERKQAEKLLNVCSKKNPTEKDIQEHVLNLLDTIAKGYGLRCRSGQTRRLQAFALPSDHDIGIDPEEIKTRQVGKNPFGGVTLRDERNRLLGYIVYPLKSKEDAETLRSYLEKNNRFHNVLVVFPDGDETTLELWQGKEPLAGKLRKDKGFEGAAEVVNLLSRFFRVSKARVRNPTELAQELAYRARYLRRLALKELEPEEEGSIRDLYNAFKKALFHDQKEAEFADAFAQTITYGLLTACWVGNDKIVESGNRFTRQNAYKFLPSTSNFLGDLFEMTLSVKLDEQRGRLLWLVDDIADLLDRINVTYVFGVGDKESDQATDPVIHFYEPFLAAYDNELRNKRGVYFTPRPAVSYIVRNVHELLQTEFGLEDGLASIDTWSDVQKRIPDIKLPNGVKAIDTFVCILDIATGTGTFLYECIEVIERTMKEKWLKELKKLSWDDPEILNRWQKYVPKHLLSRLYGYELMMSSYSIAHLKIALKLMETGYHVKEGERLHVYLTNSLETPADVQKNLDGIMSVLSKESLEVKEVKQKKKFTVVIGNPPYSGHSLNNGEWISRLVRDYYFVDGNPIGERNSKWLQDDYVKFIRLGQNYIDQTGVGVFGFITNHGYIDNPTFRGMRQSLLSSFSDIFVLDLHGNIKKRETTSDGGVDENVFDIQQGVAIIIAARRLKNKHILKQADVSGTRKDKYEILTKGMTKNPKWQIIRPVSPFYMFLPQDENIRIEYLRYTSIKQIMPISVLGFQTHRDGFAIAFDHDTIISRIEALRNPNIKDLAISKRFGLLENLDWSVSSARKKIRADKKWKNHVIRCLYRPFDIQWCYFSSAVMDRPRRELLNHVAGKENLCLLVPRQISFPPWKHCCVSDIVAESCLISLKSKEGNYNFPLYLYPDRDSLDFASERRLNFSTEFLSEFASAIKISQSGQQRLPTGFSPEDILHYIYAVFYSPGYRNRYEEFLKSDFPRLPYPVNLVLCKDMVNLGSKLVAMHLMDSTMFPRYITTYKGPNNPEVGRVGWSNDTVWINATATKKGQPAKPGTVGFLGVSDAVWNFHIGGYQVCEKWLKDRKGRTLTVDEISHYQKIIVAISETIRIMKEIDEVINKHGGWPGAFHSGQKGDEQ